MTEREKPQIFGRAIAKSWGPLLKDLITVVNRENSDEPQISFYSSPIPPTAIDIPAKKMELLRITFFANGKLLSGNTFLFDTLAAIAEADEVKQNLGAGKLDKEEMKIIYEAQRKGKNPFENIFLSAQQNFSWPEIIQKLSS